MDTPPLFIIGAGASAGYNLPLGFDLVKKIVRNLGRVKWPPNTTGFGDRLHEANYESSMRDLALRAQESRSLTIDAFLRHAHNRNDLLNAIANVIWEAEDEVLRYAPNTTDDWIAWIYHNRLKREPAQFPKTGSLSFCSITIDFRKRYRP